MKCKEAPATAHVGVRVQHFRPSLEYVILVFTKALHSSYGGVNVNETCRHETSGAWDFTSPGAIVDWDIMLVVGETKFYVHKTVCWFPFG